MRVPVFTWDRCRQRSWQGDHPGSRTEHVVDGIEIKWKTPADKWVPTQKVGPDPRAEDVEERRVSSWSSRTVPGRRGFNLQIHRRRRFRISESPRPPRLARLPARKSTNQKDNPGSRWVPTQKVGPDPEGGSRVRGPFPGVEVSIFEDIAAAASGSCNPSAAMIGRAPALWRTNQKDSLGSRRVPTQKVGPDPKAWEAEDRRLSWPKTGLDPEGGSRPRSIGPGEGLWR